MVDNNNNKKIIGSDNFMDQVPKKKQKTEPSLYFPNGDNDDTDSDNDSSDMDCESQDPKNPNINNNNNSNLNKPNVLNDALSEKKLKNPQQPPYESFGHDKNASALNNPPHANTNIGSHHNNNNSNSNNNSNNGISPNINIPAASSNTHVNYGSIQPIIGP